MQVAVILGSAFEGLQGLAAAPVVHDTPHGPAELWPCRGGQVVFRHGRPRRWLPNQVPYRAHAWALQQAGCGALLVTSSVGVLAEDVPLFEPLLVSDLVMLDNRLPDGTACTLFDRPREGQGHLVVEHGLFSRELSDQLRGIARNLGRPLSEREVVFLYRDGPRTKTAAENRLFAGLGIDVNSMTLAPEVVLASELGIPCAALVTGHKVSRSDLAGPDEDAVTASLVAARAAQEALVLAFLEHGRAVPFRNHLYRFD